LYTITSVIDDIDFNITHILRGEDHVTNTAVQIQLFEALGRKSETIHFGHTTLLMDANGGPLSKRLGSLGLHDFRKAGIEPMAINSLLARLGTSLPVEPRLTLDELAQDFDLSTFSRTPPRFDPKDLEILNQKLFKIMPFEKVSDRLPDVRITPHIWDIIRGNLNRFDDIQKWIQVCFGQIQPTITDADYLHEALALLPKTPWTEETWGVWTSLIKEKTGRKGKDLFMPLREALTGTAHGPEMKALLPVIGYDKTVARLKGEE
jgi:glutamyl-tRNA synthetase